VQGGVSRVFARPAIGSFAITSSATPPGFMPRS
jgi:hypothetical protein